MTMRKSQWVLGTMSGTSLDGVDAAFVLTDGHRIEGFGPVGYRAYDEGERAVLRAALGRWPGEAGVDEAAEVIEAAHAELLSRMIADHPDFRPEYIGFHGQTLAHDPRGRGTHQAGNGAVLAAYLGVPVVWDFRSSDVELGGQGAPLAPYFHFACAKYAGLSDPVVFLNLGGVGNVTWLDPALPGPDTEGAILAFDTGPANAPVNDLMQVRRGKSHDEGGKLAEKGRVDEALVSRFLDHPYFFKMPPKSLDRNDFHAVMEWVAGMGDADAAAVLTAFAAASVARGAEHFPYPPQAVYVAGGGRLNAALMVELARRLPCEVAPVEDLGLDGDMLEAQAFAHLAARVVRGLPTSGPMTTGVAAQVGGGQVSRPD
ncbi:anhydro-N-acetylmuramic acid kinase [Thioclava sp. A2]|uniref:anhydro-N-acetylmuramic acid kinase n=1 Tax=Thioclava sp. FCG-A2 TaxID=3080562 RepID=UPI0029548E43|nr:anhydro-N-acetylmuramic acid kinase [Thioclava sp. A2]MDV7269564.1 anhydro-N-acetylmuramic acid kinase [Thioclava sp. A2]